MAVIEAIMFLYAKEVVTPDRVTAAIQRFSHGSSTSPMVSDNHEQGLLLWISYTNEALKKKISQEIEAVVTTNGEVRGLSLLGSYLPGI